MRVSDRGSVIQLTCNSECCGRCPRPRMAERLAWMREYLLELDDPRFADGVVV